MVFFGSYAPPLPALVFTYDFHPNAQTLYQFHFAPKPPPPMGAGRHNKQPVHAHIPERTIWTYVVQIANAIKAVHDAGMALRTIDATKILVSGKNRIRINCCGIFDVVGWNPQHGIEVLQVSLH